MTDIEIARKFAPEKIHSIATKAGIEEKDFEPYGYFKAKLSHSLINEDKIKKSKLILVTAITPTPAGEGKTTVSVGLNDGLRKLGKISMAALREPSLGPVFGIKGGATGGGYSQVIPMEDINLHFTGDFNAIEKANNLLSALIDNALHFNTSINLDPKKILWKRCIDMNDRSLRQIMIGLGNKTNGVIREDGFNITAASEIMAILCLSENFEDLKQRLSNILIGFSTDNKPVFAGQLNAQNAMAILLKDAIKPNLVQSLEGNPVIIHGGPFANIAQGTNSVIATKTAMSLSDYVVTEAGFAADLGAEKFFHIKCRNSGLVPSAVVIVATIRALKHHGECSSENLSKPNIHLVEQGFVNLKQHIENIQKFGYNPIVAINHFYTDAQEEIETLKLLCNQMGIKAELSKGWANGGEGCTDLAKTVINEIEANKINSVSYLYPIEADIKSKINTLAKDIYRADKVEFSTKAINDLNLVKKLGLEHLPICMAKTQKSFSEDEKAVGAPRNFKITIKEIEFATGAGFVIPIVGNMVRMPGLPLVPSSDKMGIDKNGMISGIS